MKKESLIPLECHGLRADVVLAKLFPEYSRSQLSQWMKAGLLTINGQHCLPKYKVQGGEAVSLQEPVFSEHEKNIEAQDIALHVLFEDEHLLIVNKQAGLVVHPGAGNPDQTLVNALLHHDNTLNSLPRAGIVHRLDKDTTGLLIVAKTLPSYTALVRQMQAREIQRKYLALVHGHVIAGGRIDTYYGRHPKNRLKMAVCRQGKEAVTDYTIKKQYEHLTLLDIKLLTGRTHQIRVHMAHIHHPIVGDPLYGGQRRMPAGFDESAKIFLQQFKRQALHAYSLSLQHPFSHKPLTITAPLPDDFNKLLVMLDGYFE